MHAKLPGETPDTIDLCAIDSEPWLGGSVECPYVAGYQTGRLLHCLDWLLLRLALRPRLDRRPLLAVFQCIVNIVAVRFGSDTVAQLKIAARKDFKDWSAWFNSEARDFWNEALRDDPSPDADLLRTALRPGFPMEGFQRDRVQRESDRLGEEPLDVWQPDEWRQTPEIVKVLDSQWDPTSRVAVETGYHVDDGIRPLHAPREVVLRTAIQGSAANPKRSPPAGWLDRVLRLLAKAKISGALSQTVLNQPPCNDIPNVVDVVDREIRAGLTALWTVETGRRYLNLVINPLTKTIRRDEPEYSAMLPMVLGNDFWVIEALLNNDGTLSHEITKALFFDPEGGNSDGHYPETFRVLKQKINVKLIPLDVGIDSVYGTGWKLVDRRDQTPAGNAFSEDSK